ncbi:hypothetical protein [Nonlabens xiamenensis]|uniref:hypothetical protein n=1 Tax=Nonlabens xiamenensis TaxID=2341043 RepID=UPI000F609D87|nr:hypothetical protein [Nonlabens xiamenensis]
MIRFTLLLLMILICSCEARLEDDIRASFSTRLLDINGDPVQGAQVTAANYNYVRTISGSRLHKFSIDDDFILGEGITDDNGEVSFLMLVDGGCYINFTESDRLNNLFIPRSQLENNLAVQIPEIRLKQLANVQVEFVNTSGTNQIFTTDFKLESVYCNRVYIDGEVITDPGCEEPLNRSNFFNQSTDDGLFEFEVLFPSVIEVSYTSPSGVEMTQSFAVTQTNQRYEIQY